MSIFIEGTTDCGICRLIIKKGDNFISLPAFVFNENDPLIQFNDGVFHESCFLNHPFSQRVVMRIEELNQAVSIENRICSVCQNTISNPDDYLFLGFLSDFNHKELEKYNYIKLHISCLPKWKHLEDFRNSLRESIYKREITGNFYENILEKLELF